MKLYKKLFLEIAERSDKDTVIGTHTFSLMIIKDSEGNIVSTYDCFRLENVKIDIDNGRTRIIPEMFGTGLEVVHEKHLIRSVKLDDEDREIDLRGYIATIENGESKLVKE